MALGSLPLLSLETRAARIAATLDARPELGSVWRRIAGLVEASASLSLEDIRVPEYDIMRPELGISPIRGEPQATHTATAIYRTVLRPGTLVADPAGAFDRAFNAARMTSLVDVDEGGRVEYPSMIEQQDWEDARALFSAVAPEILRHASPIFLRAITIARLAGDLAPERHPAAERLLFMAAEGEMRRDLVLSDPIIAQPVSGLEPKVFASWVFLPSVALSTQGFRAWSPFSRTGWGDIIQRLDRVLGREAGRIGQIQTWISRLDEEFIGQTAKSRRRDFSRLLKETPVLTSDTVATSLDVTQRSARNLIDDAVAMGLLERVTERHHYRIYAAPSLAEMIADRGRARRERETTNIQEESPTNLRQALRDEKPEFEARVEVIMGDIDAALAGLDAALERSRTAELLRGSR